MYLVATALPQDNAFSAVSAWMNIPVEQQGSSSSPTRLYAATSSGSLQLIAIKKVFTDLFFTTKFSDCRMRLQLSGEECHQADQLA